MNRWLAAVREDRFFSLLLGCAAVLLLLPLFVTDLPPLQDLPNHVALASMLSHTQDPVGLASQYFEVRRLPLPYTIFYWFLWACTRLLGLVWGLRLVLATALLSLPLGVARLLSVLGRNKYMVLFAFACGWSFNMKWGFVSFSLCLGLGLFILQKWLQR